MNQLDMIKAFAELEGVDFSQPHNCDFIRQKGKGGKYNPITDLALTMKAVMDYSVQITHSMVRKGKIIVSIRGAFDAVTIFDKEYTPHAIIECILKSKGLYK